MIIINVMFCQSQCDCVSASVSGFLVHSATLYKGISVYLTLRGNIKIGHKVISRVSSWLYLQLAHCTQVRTLQT